MIPSHPYTACNLTLQPVTHPSRVRRHNLLHVQVSAHLAAAVTGQSRGFAETAVAAEQLNFDELAKNVSDLMKRLEFGACCV